MSFRRIVVHGLCLTALVLLSLLSAQAAENPVVVIDTSLGEITAELNAARAPISVENFLAYVEAGYYDGTVFHRVIKGFMIQGGGFTEAMEKKPTREPIKNEAGNGLKNTMGTLAMARLPQIHSATAQFFINTTNNRALDHSGQGASNFGYAVFGKVTEGLAIVRAIEGVSTTTKDVPVEAVVIKSIRLKAE